MAVPVRRPSWRCDAVVALLIALLFVVTAPALLLRHRTIRDYLSGEVAAAMRVAPHLSSSAHKSDDESTLPELTQRQRIRHILQRLSRFEGSGRPSVRVVHAAVSMIGVLGMFSAIVGAIVGPWVADTADDTIDEDRFSYWVREDDDEDDERCCGVLREERYWLVRLLDLP